MILIKVCIIILSIRARVILVFDYLFYAYCLIHLSLFELGNLKFISMIVRTEDWSFCVFLQKKFLSF